jgi:hypothetical protein
MSTFSNGTYVVLFLCDLHLLNWFSPTFCPISRILTDVITLLYNCHILNWFNLTFCPSLEFWPTSLTLHTVYIFSISLFSLFLNLRSAGTQCHLPFPSLLLHFFPSAPTVAPRKVDGASARPGALAEGWRRNVGNRRLIRYEFILVRIGVESWNDWWHWCVREAPGKAKRTSEAFAVNRSIIDRRSETETKDIMRWEGGRIWCP